MSLFKKPKRNFRQRVKRSDSEEDEDHKENGQKQENIENQKLAAANAHNSASIGVAASRDGEGGVVGVGISGQQQQPSMIYESKTVSNKVSTKAVASKSVLSFGDDEEEGEEEVFKVKKSSQSRRLAKMLEKERKQKKNPRREQNIAETGKCVAYLPNEAKETDSSFVVNGEEAEEMDLESEAENGQNDPFKKILESGVIPDAAMIHAARKRRQMARELGDFISVDETDQCKGNSSRLVRDDDNDKSDEDEEDGGRISFTVNTAAREREKVREAFLSANNERESESGGDEHDEELQRWEEEQIRKGVSIPQIQTSAENHYYTRCYYSSTSGQVAAGTLLTTCPVPQATTVGQFLQSSSSNVDYICEVEQSVEKRNAADPALVVMPPDLNFEAPIPEMVRQRLQERFESLKEVYRACQRDLDNVRLTLKDSRQHIELLEEEGPGLARSFAFYQETRGYVTDLVECLNEKVVQINALELAMNTLLKQRTTKLIQRRQQDIKDQAEEFSKLCNRNANTSITEAAVKEKLQVEESAKTRRAAEREGRRSRRRKTRESKHNKLKHYEGMSSDDEETEADITRFLAEKDRILRDASSVFEDVVDDFSSLGCIKERFEEWRRKYSSTYSEAYVGLCLPKVFNPLVRLQLISWNPLQEGRSFEDMNWYETLMFYGFDESAGIEVVLADGDASLVPMIVERVIVPKVTGAVEFFWDPMSTSQTLRLVRLIKKLVEEYPTISGTSKNTKMLIQAVVSRLRRTLDDDVYVPLFPKAIMENTSLGANAFFQRQFWSCVKLLRNILSWQGILTDALLQELALDCLLNRYVLLALQTWPGGCDVDKCVMITSIFPRTWFANLTEDRTLPQLEMFCRYLKNVAATLDKQNMVGPQLTPKTDSRETLKDIIKILASIRAMDHAMSLSNQFTLKDLKSFVSGST